MTALELHKQDLKAGQAKLKTLTQGTDIWWATKDKIKKYEIAWAQSANMALERAEGKLATGSDRDFEMSHLYFYEYLTSPYRPTKRAGKEGVANIDSEINDEDLK